MAHIRQAKLKHFICVRARRLLGQTLWQEEALLSHETGVAASISFFLLGKEAQDEKGFNIILWIYPLHHTIIREV